MRNQELVIAVDGGQTTTLALVAERSGTILGAGTAGPSNHIHEPGGIERLENALRVSIGLALRNAGQSGESVVSICLGMTGGMERAGEIVQSMMLRSKVQAHHDTVTALSGASLLQPGVIVIAGTGAITYGQLADGSSARADGWGYLIGDEGSAYEIGCSALKAVYRASDGRGKSTTLSTRILAHFKMGDLRQLHKAVYGLEITRPQIAGLASEVAEAAADGDETAQELLERAGRSLAESALAVITRLNVREKGITVYTTGGVFRAGELVLKPFREALAAASPSIIVREAAFSPVVGALFIALDAAGTALTADVIHMIQSTLPEAAVSKQAR